MSRWLRAAFFVAGFLGLAGLLSVAMLPDYEVHYDAQAPQLVCAAGRCYASYHLEVGNTGSEPQERVRVRLAAAALDEAVLQPRAAAFGVRRLPIEVTETDDVRTLAFGPLAARDRVALTFTLAVPERAPGWDALGLAVEPARGTAHPGSPAALTFGRFLFSAGRGLVALIP